jgi:hypothetical protein
MSESITEGFGTLPNSSADFRKVPQDAEGFHIVRNTAERSEQHTLTVREVTRLFEHAGVPRTERSIINWCQPNRQGIARLDAYYDTNERKYFITEQSTNAAIEEELSKQAREDQSAPDEFRSVPPSSKPRSESDQAPSEGELRELQREIMDLKIANRGKDQFIELLTKEREEFSKERRDYITKLISLSREIGGLSSQTLESRSRSVSDSASRGA